MTQYRSFACLIALVLGLAATPAVAQSSWLFGPQKNSVDDKSVVKFPKKYRPGDIVVSFGDRRLYHVTKAGLATSYPIAVPRAQSRWSGVERVSYKKVDPSWTPTARMRRENPKLPAFVPGGHRLNPLGVRALYLGNTLYRIHGTDAPWTIGHNVSKGCVRMHNAHVVELYDRVKVGARVIATWDRYKAPEVVASNESSEDTYEKIFGTTN
ncbi:MAG: L,D-transpeptidase [Hyphomicrobiaceae bacterium]